MRRRTFLETIAAAAATGVIGASSYATDSALPKIKIAQIGTGHSHAAGKFTAVRSRPDVFEIVGIAESDPALRAKAEQSATYAGVKWHDEAELLSLPSLQAVVVETRLADALPTAHRAIAAGKHIHLDKPGSLNHDDFRTMRLEAERRGLTVQMGYMLRYNGAFEILFQGVREGWFGDVLEINAMMGKLADDRIRRELSALPGGGMFELACHLVDAVVTVLGKPQQVTAYSTPTVVGPGEPQDNQLAVLQYPRATATIRCNHADPFGGPRRRFGITGTQGSMEIEPLESGKFRMMLSEPHDAFPKGESVHAATVAKDRYVLEFLDLAKVIRGEKKLAWDAAHDIAVHETVLRAAGVWKDG